MIHGIILSFLTRIFYDFQTILSEGNDEAIRNLFLFYFSGSMQLRSQLGYSFSITEGSFIGEHDLT